MNQIRTDYSGNKKSQRGSGRQEHSGTPILIRQRNVLGSSTLGTVTGYCRLPYYHINK